MHRPVYQVCDSSSCSIHVKVKRRTPLLQLAADFRLGSDLLAGGPRKSLTASGGSPAIHKSLSKAIEAYTEVRM